MSARLSCCALFSLFLFSLSSLSSSTPTKCVGLCASVYKANDNSFSVKFGVRDSDNAVAWGEYLDEVNRTGWGRLYVTANPKYQDEDQAFAAGMAEGAVTADLVYLYWLSTKDYLLFDEEQPGLDEWLVRNNLWTRAMVKANEKQSTFWRHVGTVLLQMDGLRQAYNEFRSPNSTSELSEVEFLRFQAGCDLDDINESLFPPSKRVDWSLLTFDQRRRRFRLLSHCSALIKVTHDFSNLYAGHTTWYYYSTMLRIYKVYDLPLHNPSTVASRVAFSSSPGMLTSGDDYYTMNSGLVALETSLVVMNMSLYDYVVPENLLYYLRIIVANRVADSGQMWAEVFTSFNSGTYNNQWMVVDYNRFTPGKPLQNDTLWVIEQMPRYCQSGDQTGVLQFGYWPSYNVPFYPFIYAVSGNQEYAREDPVDYDYQLCARAEIFRRDQAAVYTFEDYQKIIRYNDYQQDPLSLKDPGNAIASRFDLETNADEFDYFGGIDGKATDYYLNLLGGSMAVCGPSNDIQPTFIWPNYDVGMPHYGQPNVFNFSWEFMPSIFEN